MALASCLLFIENDNRVWMTLQNIDEAFAKWKKEDTEVAQSAKRTALSLIPEGFEDTLEQLMKHDTDGLYGHSVVYSAAVFDCHIVNRPLSKQFLVSLNDASLPVYHSHSRLLNDHQNTPHLSHRNGMYLAFPPFHSHLRCVLVSLDVIDANVKLDSVLFML
ncbi:hypothetical protein BLNAU_11370 [Blattamonas nauphoetae]|uniref:Uncharacterized protein n=1 Tax=Blattamonas nauphoetae TaxID=2049346 RepID=A0ABQ9XRR9_9EUKA|nr:hypothetical protein BLNAU_11370 [Blattamonas nauphoetae]